jgi:hypothetical protein
MAQRWWLEDAEERSRESPDSFFIPPRERREALEPGDVVKLIFLFEPPAPSGTTGERMWVEVTAVQEGGYTGELLNEPGDIEELRPGDAIRFEAKHVAARQVSDEEAGYKIGTFALVSPHLAIGAPRPDFVARAPVDRRDGEADSGWRLGAQLDYDAPSEEPPRWNDLGWLTDRYPELEPLFQEDAATGFWAWDESGGRYETALPPG